MAKKEFFPVTSFGGAPSPLACLSLVTEPGDPGDLRHLLTGGDRPCLDMHHDGAYSVYGLARYDEYPTLDQAMRALYDATMEYEAQR